MNYLYFNWILWGSLGLTVFAAGLKLCLQNRSYPDPDRIDRLGNVPRPSLWRKIGWFPVCLPFLCGWFYLTLPFVHLVLISQK